MDLNTLDSTRPLFDNDVLFINIGIVKTRCFLKMFKACIIYVGKGTAWRDNVHMYDVKNAIIKHKILKGHKRNHISREWKKGGSLVIRKVSYGINSYEALCNENAIINCVGLNKISNIKRGEPHGLMEKWSTLEVINYGNGLLLNCLENMTRENPIYLDFKAIITRTK